MKLVALLCCLFICSCSSAYQIQSAHVKEVQAWDKATALSEEQCSTYGSIHPRKVSRQNAIAFHRCLSNIIHQTVLPNAMFPSLVLNADAHGGQIAEDYAQGNITTQSYYSKSDQNLADYLDSVQRKLNEAYQIARIDDQRRSDSLNSFSQSMSELSQQQQAREQQDLQQRLAIYQASQNQNHIQAHCVSKPSFNRSVITNCD